MFTKFDEIEEMRREHDKKMKELDIKHKKDLARIEADHIKKMEAIKSNFHQVTWTCGKCNHTREFPVMGDIHNHWYKCIKCFSDDGTIIKVD